MVCQQSRQRRQCQAHKSARRRQGAFALLVRRIAFAPTTLDLDRLLAELGELFMVNDLLGKAEFIAFYQKWIDIRMVSVQFGGCTVWTKAEVQEMQAELAALKV